MATQENLLPEEAAEYLRVTTRTLIRWRNRRVGPPWLRVGGRVLYRRCDLDTWLGEQRCEPVGRDAA